MYWWIEVVDAGFLQDRLSRILEGPEKLNGPREFAFFQEMLFFPLDHSCNFLLRRMGSFLHVVNNVAHVATSVSGYLVLFSVSVRSWGDGVENPPPGKGSARHP